MDNRRLQSSWNARQAVAGGVLALLLSACSVVAIPPTATTAPTVAPTAAPATVGVQLQSYSVAPNTTTAKAGDVTFNVANAATDQAHEFVVVKSDLAVDQLPIGSDGETIDEDAVTVVDELAEMDPGKTGTLTLNLSAGQYVLLCNRPGHYQKGMHAAFTVSP